jgi:membrane associated rhomboid family serine protease
MLVLPYQTHFSLARLPLASIGLILACVVVFFGLQGRDDALYEEALRTYSSSALPQIELPRYRDWLQRRAATDAEAQRRLQALQRQPKMALMVMQSDATFMTELKARRIITADDPQYGRWREERAQVDAILARVFTDRFSAQPGGEWWRLLTHQFLHGDLGHLVGNMIVLLVAGPFVEAAIGRWRFLLGYLASGMAAGAAHLVISNAPLIGASGAIAGAMAMVAVLYGTRRVRVFYWVFVYFDTARVPALALLPVWILNEAFQWMASGGQSRVAYSAHLAGLVVGALYAGLLRVLDRRQIDRQVDAEFDGERKAAHQSSLLRQAQEAAARLDTRRAARLYRQLVELHPDDVGYLTAYFNVSLLSKDSESLHDALLRVLWFRAKGGLTELRKIYLQMSQPPLINDLPVDEQLRLARRLVSAREDAAALRVLDRVLEDTNLRTLYGRQTADCLLGLYTAYSRYGLKHQAASVQERLARYFPKPAEIGGLSPQVVPPPTIRATTRRADTLRGPDTIYIDLSR